MAGSYDVGVKEVFMDWVSGGHFRPNCTLHGGTLEGSKAY